MPIDADLKAAYVLLYDKREPEQALSQYDSILKQNSESVMALVYKAACLEKLYFGESSWHNEITLENAKDLLEKALKIAEQRGDRSKIGFVQFRLFIHYFNNHDATNSLEAFNKAKQYGYDDPTLSMWESKLQVRLTKWKKKNLVPESASITSETNIPTATVTSIPDPTSVQKEDIKPIPASTPVAVVSEPTVKESVPTTTNTTAPLQPIHEKTRTDWYQTSNSITISLFTTRLPSDVSEIRTTLNKNNQLSLSWILPIESSEFQYDINLSQEVDKESIKFKIFTKKVEISMDKLNKGKTWKTLEITKEQEQEQNNDNSNTKKQKDWSKITFDEEDEIDAGTGTADEFFQKLYSNADPDTRKAMMKSFMESNGTTLNTNWEDVKTDKVEPSPPDGMELKQW